MRFSQHRRQPVQKGAGSIPGSNPCGRGKPSHSRHPPSIGRDGSTADVDPAPRRGDQWENFTVGKTLSSTLGRCQAL